MTELSDQQLDELLRRSFPSDLADHGFSDRVLRALPPRPRPRPWLLPLAAMAGVLLAWLALLPSPLLQQAAREWLAADFHASTAVVCALLFGMGLLGCGWALEEGS